MSQPRKNGSRIRVVIDMPVHKPALVKIKAMTGIDLVMADGRGAGEARELPAEMIDSCEVLFSTFLPTNHSRMRRLKMMQIGSSGIDHLKDGQLASRGVHLCNAAGVFDIPIAEWNIAMILALTRNVPGLLDNQRAKRWEPSVRFQRELRGSVVGFWGYGGFARETARLCKALGLQVHTLTCRGARPRPDKYVTPNTGDPKGNLPDRVFTMEEKHEFLAGLDFLVMAVPLNIETKGCVGEKELRALPRHAFVLNPARGPLIQEVALLRALREQWIAGAALDTHYAYPLPPEHPLWTMPNVILSPHIAGSDGGQHYWPRIWNIFAENLSRYVTGESLLNKVPTDQLTVAQPVKTQTGTNRIRSSKREPLPA